MSQNPYAQPTPYQDPYAYEAGPERLSVLAIVALVTSLVCFIPGMGILATILGIAALVVIRGARGRLAGTGLAVSGIVLGLLFTMIWMGIAVGFGGMLNVVRNEAAKLNEAALAIQSGDRDKVAAMFVPGAAAELTPEVLAAFRAEYEPELGAFKGISTSLRDIIADYQAIGQQMQTVQQSAGNNVVPIPGRFEKGTAMIALYLDPSSGRPSNVGVVVPSKSTVTWLMPRGAQPPQSQAPPVAPAPPEAPEPVVPPAPPEAPR